MAQAAADTYTLMEAILLQIAPTSDWPFVQRNGRDASIAYVNDPWPVLWHVYWRKWWYW